MGEVADPLSLFAAEGNCDDAKQQADSPQPDIDTCDPDHDPDDTEEARLRKLRRQIDDYVHKHKLDHRVSGIMQNMHPGDVTKVMQVPFPEDCRNPSGFVVSQIRRTERDVGRPKDYRWDGRSWNENASFRYRDSH